MLVNAEGVGNVNNAPLEQGWYKIQGVEVVPAQTRAGNDQLQIKVIIQDGPEQENGKDPIGKKLVIFLATTYKGYKDGGEFARGKLAEALNAFGVDVDGDSFDYDDFIGAEALTLIKVKADQYGIPTEDMVAFKPVGDEGTMV